MNARYGTTMRMVAGAMLACGMLAGTTVAGAQRLTRAELHAIVPQQGVRTDAPPPDALVAEGQELYDAGRYKEAAASFERAIQLGVARPHEAARSVARSYEKLGNRKQAHRWAEIAELIAAGPVQSRLSRVGWVT